MKTIWTKGLEPDASKEMKLHFSASTQLRKRLVAILEEKSDSKDATLLNADFNGQWAYRQAHGQGYKAALKEIMSILK